MLLTSQSYHVPEEGTVVKLFLKELMTITQGLSAGEWNDLNCHCTCWEENVLGSQVGEWKVEEDSVLDWSVSNGGVGRWVKVGRGRADGTWWPDRGRMISSDWPGEWWVMTGMTKGQPILGRVVEIISSSFELVVNFEVPENISW